MITISLELDGTALPSKPISCQVKFLRRGEDIEQSGLLKTSEVVVNFLLSLHVILFLNCHKPVNSLV